jgi:hypothetical protein
MAIQNILTGFRLCFRHPDKNKDPGAEDRFIQISKAYEVRAILRFRAATICS